MSVQIAAFVASRLFAAYLFVTYVLSFTLQCVGVLVIGRIGSGIGSGIYGGLSFTAAFSALVAAALWFGAGWISDRVSGGLPETGRTGLDTDNWKALVVAAIGTLFVLKGTEFFSHALKVLADREAFQQDRVLFFTVSSGLLFAFVGVALVAWSRSIVGGVAALRSWFEKPAFGEDDQ